jgi:ankyrin repeat protein
MITNNFFNNVIFISSLWLTTIAFTMELCKKPLPHRSYSQKIALHYECTQLIWTNGSPHEFPQPFDLELTDEDGDTLLHVAAELDRHPILTLLLEKGANPNKKNKFQHTPFMLAINNQSRDCCTTLIKHGATKESMYKIQLTKAIRCKELYRCKGTKSKSDDSKKYYAFMAPVHSALLNKELMPLYEQQQQELAVFANFILQHYLDQYDGGLVPILAFMKKNKHHYGVRSDQQEIRYLIIRKLLEVLDLPKQKGEQ